MGWATASYGHWDQKRSPSKAFGLLNRLQRAPPVAAAQALSEAR